MEFQFSSIKPADILFDYLSDLEKFSSVHPLIRKIDVLGENRFRIHERSFVRLFPYTFTYVVTTRSAPDEKKVFMDAVVFRLTKIHIAFHVSENGEGSVVKESLDIRSVLPVHPLLHRIFKVQHAKLFRNIDLL